METMKRNAIDPIAYMPRPAAPISGKRLGWTAFGATAGGVSALAARGARRPGALVAAAGGPPDSASLT